MSGVANEGRDRCTLLSEEFSSGRDGAGGLSRFMELHEDEPFSEVAKPFATWRAFLHTYWPCTSADRP